MTLKRISILAIVTCFATLGFGCENLIDPQYQEETANLGWIEVEPGLQYQDLKIDNKSLFLASIDPQIFHLEIITNPEPPESLSIKQLHKQQDSKLSFNGGFYTPEFQPTGLLISNTEMLHPYQNAELTNGVFILDKNNQPKLLTVEQFNQTDLQTLRFALQAGPILLDQNGQIAVSSDSQNKASRTAIGIDQNNHIIVIILRQTLIERQNTESLYQFAKILQKLDLHSTLNLDGGNSTGLIINNTYFPELEKVQHAIITKPNE